jgi:hypothetical protein
VGKIDRLKVFMSVCLCERVREEVIFVDRKREERQKERERGRD